MKVAFYTTSFFPYICGVSTAVLNFSLGLNKRGHQVILCIPKAKSPVFAKLRKLGIKIVFLPSFKTKLYKGVNVGTPSTKTFLQIKKWDPDIIHFHTPAFAGWEAILTAKILKKPLVGHFHTYYMSPEAQKVVKLPKRGEEIIEKMLWQYTKSVYNSCDLVLSASEYAKKDLEKHNLKKPVEVLANPIDLKSLKGASVEKIKDLKKKYKLEEKTVLYVGRVSKEKSMDVLLFAFNLVVRKIPEAKLILVGDGPVMKEMKALTKDLGLEKNVVFMGSINYDKLLQSGVYEASKLFATASSCEVQPISILEAMGFGLPIVGVKAMGVTELIRDNGIVCEKGNTKELAEAIVKILEDQRLEKKYGENSKKRILKEHGMDGVCEELENKYFKIT